MGVLVGSAVALSALAASYYSGLRLLIAIS